MTSTSTTTSYSELNAVLDQGRSGAGTPTPIGDDGTELVPVPPVRLAPIGTVGPRIDFVELRSRWRGDAEFGTALDLDAHREEVFDALSLILPAGHITV
jgi:hypothetical protein